MSIVRTSAIASLTAQFVIGAVTAIAFFVDVKSPRDREDLNAPDVPLSHDKKRRLVAPAWTRPANLANPTKSS